MPGTELEPELELELGAELEPETGLELGTELEGIEMELGMKLELETEADPGNKYSGLHPWQEDVVRRKSGQGVDRTLESGAGYYTDCTDIS